MFKKARLKLGRSYEGGFKTQFDVEVVSRSMLTRILAAVGYDLSALSNMFRSSDIDSICHTVLSIDNYIGDVFAGLFKRIFKYINTV